MRKDLLHLFFFSLMTFDPAFAEMNDAEPDAYMWECNFGVSKGCSQRVVKLARSSSTEWAICLFTHAPSCLFVCLQDFL